MTAFDSDAFAEFDASASVALPRRRSWRGTALLRGALYNAAVFALLLALALAPLTLRLYLIMR